MKMRNRLICADSRNLDFIENETVDLVFTSPPYFDLKDYSHPQQIGKDQSWSEFYVSCIQVFEELERVLKPGGVLAINSATYTIIRAKSISNHRHEINLPGIFTELVEKHTTLERERLFVWDKISASRIGGQPYPLKAYGFFEIEFVHIFRKPGERTVDPDLYEKSRLSNEEWHDLVQSIWHVHRRDELNKGPKCIHPCPFPPKLADRVVKLYSYVGDLVLDPFCGIANTCIGAARNGRDFIGVDINPVYLKEAQRRLAEMVGLKPAPVGAV